MPGKCDLGFRLTCLGLLLAAATEATDDKFLPGFRLPTFRNPLVTADVHRRSLLQEDCGLKLCGTDPKYASCKVVPSADGSTGFVVFWNLEPNENGTTLLHAAIDAPSKGWAGWGFPGAKGGMINGSAVIVKADSSETGASADCYFLGGKSRSSVAPPCKMHVTDVTACSASGRLQASFTILLQNSAEDLQNFLVPTINAMGQLDSSGSLRKHPGSGNRAMLELGAALRKQTGVPTLAPSPGIEGDPSSVGFRVATAPKGGPAPPAPDTNITGVSEQPRDGKNTQG